ncbi:Fic family protein [Subtercola boreus]|uniref:protein adenylyltransferase n=1 Tax=Subtercola boreus TaxID=120213 RepID=A0A3E0W9Z3_9MICO|nr:Fic family protein [Subtercola boreus]RFA18781.1 hypothetical protein B7R24_13635 [Subtercola boreus]RFA18897.1 hypothetical protein B7R23_13625 [Subtercola boreus]RFA25433.1 hypothetical protein B7R25_13735 [Subtercola boreus]
MLSVSVEQITYRVNYANAALALAHGDPGDDAHQDLVQAVAAEEVTAEEAIALTCERSGLSIGTEAAPPITCWEDYLIPGSTALRSRLVDDSHPSGIEDPVLFRAVEQQISRFRLVELAAHPIEGPMDYGLFGAVHRHLFQDIYWWAGEQRVGPDTPMVRFARDAVDFDPGDPAAPAVKYQYFAGPDISEAVSVQFALLLDLATRTDMPRAEMISRMGEHGGELNTIHAFRDGHSRTLFVYAMKFFTVVGYPTDPANFLNGNPLRDRIVHARYQNQATSLLDGYEGALDDALSGGEPEGARVRR